MILVSSTFISHPHPRFYSMKRIRTLKCQLLKFVNNTLASKNFFVRKRVCIAVCGQIDYSKITPRLVVTVTTSRSIILLHGSMFVFLCFFSISDRFAFTVHRSFVHHQDQRKVFDQRTAANGTFSSSNFQQND